MDSLSSLFQRPPVILAPMPRFFLNFFCLHDNLVLLLFYFFVARDFSDSDDGDDDIVIVDVRYCDILSSTERDFATFFSINIL